MGFGVLMGGNFNLTNKSFFEVLFAFGSGYFSPWQAKGELSISVSYKLN